MPIIAGNFLKQLALGCVALILCSALLQKVLADAPEAHPALLTALLLASPLAYAVREACKKTTARRPGARARERTRILIGEFEED